MTVTVALGWPVDDMRCRYGAEQWCAVQCDSRLRSVVGTSKPWAQGSLGVSIMEVGLAAFWGEEAWRSGFSRGVNKITQMRGEQADTPRERKIRLACGQGGEEGKGGGLSFPE